MSLLKNVLKPRVVHAHPDSYGHTVLLAWEFDPTTFQNMMKKVTALLKKGNVAYGLMHQEKPSAESGRMWGLKGNDWSHVSIMLLKDYSEQDEQKLEELAKASTPQWSIKGFKFLKPMDDKYRYLVMELDYPPAAEKFESEFRKYAGDRIQDRSQSKFKFVPHASLVSIKTADEEKVEALLKEMKLPSGKIPTEAIQVWDDFQVADHILL